MENAALTRVAAFARMHHKRCNVILHSFERRFCMKKFCPTCWLTLGEEIGGKLALAAAGAYLGSRVHPVVAVIAGALGVYLGHRYIDTAIQNCPQCGTLLAIAATL